MASIEMIRDERASRDVDRVSRNRAQIRTWLYVVVLVLFALVLVGGATRLTGSGLSITQWKPIHGVVPPLSDAEWQEEFALYQKIPQYELINKGMTVEAFKSIFWWEWAHRLLARSIGMVFALPLAWFWLRGQVEQRLKLPLAGILALGGFQGFIGWWMVSSGLSERTDVSQYRLATHLITACLIFASCLWIARGLSPHASDTSPTRSAAKMAAVIACLTLFQIYLGALVAGLDAGMSYNTWPLMDGALVPGDLFIQQPFWVNLFENPKTVQFVHRCGAYVLWTLIAVHMISSLRHASQTRYARRAMVLFGLVTLQAMIGITTLILQVPVGWGVLHQGGALVVFGVALAHWRGFVGEIPRPVGLKTTG